MMRIDRPALFVKGVIALGVVLVISIFVLRRAEASRLEFQKVSGRITYLDDVSPDVELRYDAKKRFIVVDGRPPVFELFIGMDAMDFSPEMQKINSLRVGDTIDLYYDVRRRLGRAGSFNPHNLLTYYIDKDGRPMFRMGRRYNSLTWFLIGLCAVTLAVLIILKKNGRIR